MDDQGRAGVLSAADVWCLVIPDGFVIFDCGRRKTRLSKRDQ